MSAALPPVMSVQSTAAARTWQAHRQRRIAMLRNSLGRLWHETDSHTDLPTSSTAQPQLTTATRVLCCCSRPARLDSASERVRRG